MVWAFCSFPRTTLHTILILAHWLSLPPPFLPMVPGVAVRQAGGIEGGGVALGGHTEVRASLLLTLRVMMPPLHSVHTRPTLSLPVASLHSKCQARGQFPTEIYERVTQNGNSLTHAACSCCRNLFFMKSEQRSLPNGIKSMLGDHHNTSRFWTGQRRYSYELSGGSLP